MRNAFEFLPDNALTPLPDNDPYKYDMNLSVPSLINAIFDPQPGELMMYRKLIKKQIEKPYKNNCSRMSETS